jgi:hypothetical protein
MKTIKIIANKNIEKPKKRGDFEARFIGKCLALPIDFYNFFVINADGNDVFALLKMLHDKPTTVAAFLGWTQKEVRDASVKLNAQINAVLHMPAPKTKP